MSPAPPGAVTSLCHARLLAVNCLLSFCPFHRGSVRATLLSPLSSCTNYPSPGRAQPARAQPRHIPTLSVPPSDGWEIPSHPIPSRWNPPALSSASPFTQSPKAAPRRFLVALPHPDPTNNSGSPRTCPPGKALGSVKMDGKGINARRE